MQIGGLHRDHKRKMEAKINPEVSKCYQGKKVVQVWPDNVNFLSSLILETGQSRWLRAVSYVVGHTWVWMSTLT